MTAKLFFGINLGFDLTINEQLKELSVLRFYDTGLRGYLYIFNIERLHQVENLAGPVEIPGYRDKFEIEKVKVPKWKGEDIIEIVTFPKFYRVITHQKQDDGSVKPHKKDVPKPLVDRIWSNIIVRQPLNKPVKSRTMWEKICREFEITRFDRPDTHTFRGSQFFGERADYQRLFYRPMKVLVHLGRIKHHKSGKIERLI